MTRKTYDVTTWDMDKQTFTPQKGCRRGPYTQFGLRRALRRLRELGYAANRSDTWVYVSERPPTLAISQVGITHDSNGTSK